MPYIRTFIVLLLMLYSQHSLVTVKDDRILLCLWKKTLSAESWPRLTREDSEPCITEISPEAHIEANHTASPFELESSADADELSGRWSHGLTLLVDTSKPQDLYFPVLWVCIFLSTSPIFLTMRFRRIPKKSLSFMHFIQTRYLLVILGQQ